MVGIATIPGRGRRPKPTQQKIAAGNPGKRPLNENEPQFTKLTGIEAPAWLDGHALTMWETIMPELLAAQILTVPDIASVEAYCMAYKMWRKAEECVEELGITVRTVQGGTAKNPAVTVINEAKKQMMQFGALLGLDPSSRTRLRGPATTKSDDNPFDDL